MPKVPDLPVNPEMSHAWFLYILNYWNSFERCWMSVVRSDYRSYDDSQKEWNSVRLEENSASSSVHRIGIFPGYENMQKAKSAAHSTVCAMNEMHLWRAGRKPEETGGGVSNMPVLPTKKISAIRAGARAQASVSAAKKERVSNTNPVLLSRECPEIVSFLLEPHTQLLWRGAWACASVRHGQCTPCGRCREIIRPGDEYIAPSVASFEDMGVSEEAFSGAKGICARCAADEFDPESNGPRGLWIC